MGWQAVIGLEVHVQLQTCSKIFSGASTAFGGAPNTHIEALDIGLPGTLPVLNEEAVLLAIRFGLAINAKIAKRTVFDRKNYFYPDLPKGYQISQLHYPIIGSGFIDIEPVAGKQRRIGIAHAHLEEDAGKSVHDLFANQTGIDLNRAGVPLLEIVSNPEMHSSSEAGAYMRKIHRLVRYLGICDGNMQEGSLRCDANVSVRRAGDPVLGERVEVKNLNSFRFVENAIDYEISRHIKILEQGGKIDRETRLFDSDSGQTRVTRTKEQAHDYRYFPDPDLLPLTIGDELLQQVRNSLPENTDVRAERYQKDYGFGSKKINYLLDDRGLADYFDDLCQHGSDPDQAINWIMGEMAGALNRDSIDVADSPVSSQELAELIRLLVVGKLSTRLAKEVFVAVWSGAGSVAEVIKDRGLQQLSDGGQLQVLVAQILADNPRQVQQYLSGKQKVFGFFVGKVMQATSGSANPSVVNELLHKQLAKLH